MGSFFPIRRGCSPGGFSIVHALPLLLGVAGIAGGCQSGQPIASHRLIEHQAMIDFSDLKPAEAQPLLKTTAAVPRAWQQVGPIENALYAHTQWRSPSGHTAVGAAYIRLPLPLSADILMFLARHEYAKRSNDGRIASRWTDALGREWFEAENDKYHVQGYALAQGFEGWFVYFGYKVTEPPEMSEISLAARSADSFVPLIGPASGGAAAAVPTSKPTPFAEPEVQPAKHGLFKLLHSSGPTTAPAR